MLISPAAPLLVLVALAGASMVRKSATYDEPTLLASGIWYLRTFDPRVNVENPPLLKAFYALPSLAFSLNLPEPPSPVLCSYDMHDGLQYGNQVLFTQRRPHALLIACRAMVVLTAAAGGLLLYRMARTLWSPVTAGCVLWLYCLSPNILAHARLFTPDMGCTIAMLGATAAYVRMLQRPSTSRSAVAGLALGAALLTKYTALLLLPALAVTCILAPLLERPIRWRSWWAVRLRPLLVSGGLALLVLHAAYGFKGLFPTLAACGCRSPLLRTLAEIPLLARLPLPVPELWLRGLDVIGWNNRPGFPAIFLGKVYPRGGSWWYYYLVVLALKTPLPVLIMWLAGAIVLRRRLKAVPPAGWMCAVVPLLILLTFSVVAYRQLGLRYILPAWPFLFLLAGFFIAEVIEARAPLTARVAAGLLGLWFALESLAVFPHYLSYFNEIAGGPRNGWRYLAASNTDWGQDLPALARWQREHGYPDMYVLYYGTAPLSAYGVRSAPWGRTPLPAYVALSVTNYYLCYKIPLVAWLRLHGAPDAYAGWSIHIFRLPPDLPQRLARDAVRLALPDALRGAPRQGPRRSAAGGPDSPRRPR